MPKRPGQRPPDPPAHPEQVLFTLARLYADSQAGRTGRGQIDFQIDRTELFAAADCADGEARELAERSLLKAEQAGLVRLNRHSRDPALILKIRLPIGNEESLFKCLNLPSPSHQRATLASQFESAAELAVPFEHELIWRSYFTSLAAAARIGSSVIPFHRTDLPANQELICLLQKLLSWNGESLERFASCLLCHDSKRLQQVAGRLETALQQLTGGVIKTLEDLGILQNPRSVLLHGPLTLLVAAKTLDFSLLRGPFRLSSIDLHGAQLTTSATRCLTIENETTFHELAKLQSGELLIQTSYPGSATLQLLQQLPSALEFWHFGDTDLEGFEILHTLRQKTGRHIRPFQMNFRPEPPGPSLTATDRKRLESLCSLMPSESLTLQQILQAGHFGAFEQETLGRPTLSYWAFYS